MHLILNFGEFEVKNLISSRPCSKFFLHAKCHK